MNERDVYRQFRLSDAGILAHNYNLNLQREEPLWCGGGTPKSGLEMKAHYYSLVARGRIGGVITRVHTEDERFISYFGGYRKGATTTYTIGIVDLSLSNPMDVWRHDAAVGLKDELGNGMETFCIPFSTGTGKIIPWMQEEVGMRLDTRRGRIWVAQAQEVRAYVERILG